MLHWLFITMLSLSQGQPAAPCERVDGGSQLLSVAQKATLASRHPGWQVRRQCVTEVADFADIDPKYASVTAGDYDADGRIDVAVLLESQAAGRGKIVVFLSSVRGGPVVADDSGNLYITTTLRGSLGHDFDTERDFTHERDAIFAGDFHCCGFSLIWRDGKFVRIATAD